MSTKATERGSAQSPKNPPRRILVVEGDVEMRLFNAEALKRNGYRVDTAGDGEAGWNALYASSYSPDFYDLLITDNDMPRLTGAGLLGKLRATRMYLPVIMATGTLAAQESVRSPRLRPFATLLKPYTTDELLRTVRGALRVADNGPSEVAPMPDGGNLRAGD